MNTYETSATVQEQGQLHLAGVPFVPGTLVEVVVTPITNGGEHSVAAETDRTARLLAALDKARNTESIGSLNRAELYDRDILR
jgi:hypothetical protein